MKKRLSVILASITLGAVAFVMTPADAYAETVSGDYAYETESAGEIAITAYTGSEANVVIPNSIDGKKVVKIANEAFRDNETIESVVIPEGVTKLVTTDSYFSTGVFYGCTNLTSVKMPSTLTTIGKETFKGCEKLEDVVLPENLISMEDNAFRDCKSITSITIPKTVVESAAAFVGCDNLTSAVIEYGMEELPGSLFYRSGIEEVKLPNSLKVIAMGAFKDCDKLTSITIPEGVTDINGGGAFDGCDNLETVVLPSTLKNIGITVFADCPKLSNINLPDGLETIGNNAFARDSSLTSITIPKTVVSADGAFATCTALTDITVAQGMKKLPDGIFESTGVRNVKLPASLRVIGARAFMNCGKLEKIVIPEGVTDILSGTSTRSGAFYSCDLLESVVLPSTLKNMEKGAFMECKSLLSINIPASLTKLDDDTFYDCRMLTEISLPCSVKEFGARVFSNHRATFTIKGYKGTAAEGYANTNNITFVGEEHKYECMIKASEYIASKATCTAAAKYYYSCAVCKEKSTKTFVSDKTLGHDYKVVKVHAKEGADGYTVEKCSRCNATKNKRVISKIGSVKLSKTSYVYDKKAKKPAVTVKDASGKVIGSSNYTLTYYNNVKVGVAKVKVTFKGNYSGTKVLAFTITPAGTTITKVTPGSKKLSVKWKANKNEVTGYQIQYAPAKTFKNAKTMKVAGNTKVLATIKNLSAKKGYYVRIRTYKTVAGKTYYSTWSSAIKKTTRK